MKINSKKSVLAIDIGGTKLAIGVVNHKGTILESSKYPIDLKQGATSLVSQITHLARPLIAKYKIRTVGVASAGPLDPAQGLLLNPTNLKKNHQYIGQFPLVKHLKRKLKIDTYLENDAAAAALAEYWQGHEQDTENLVVITLGTGLGVGVIVNGSLLRSGRHLHTEGGHIIVNTTETRWRCGCGNLGCAEAYLSGSNFTRYTSKFYFRKNISSEQLVQLAYKQNALAKKSFAIYANYLASFITSLCVLFSPEKVVLSGGFSHSSPLFLPQTRKKLTELMRHRRVGLDLLPEVSVSQFQDESSLLGAAYIAFSKTLPT